MKKIFFIGLLFFSISNVRSTVNKNIFQESLGKEPKIQNKALTKEESVKTVEMIKASLKKQGISHASISYKGWFQGENSKEKVMMDLNIVF